MFGLLEGWWVGVGRSWFGHEGLGLVGQWWCALLGLELMGWGWSVGVCAGGFGVGGWRDTWVWSWWVGVGRSWLVLDGVGFVGWGWWVAVCAGGFGVGGLELVGRGLYWRVGALRSVGVCA